MTNREKYKQAFSAIRASDNFSLEAEKMERTAKQHRFRTMAAVVAVCATLVGGAAAAYAADAGGIQRAVQVWIHGDQTAATIQFDGNGSYSMYLAFSRQAILLAPLLLLGAWLKQLHLVWRGERAASERRRRGICA